MSEPDRHAGCRVELSGDGKASLTGPLTFESVPELFRRLMQRGGDADAPGQFDLAGVTSADSAGLALLLEWQARARSAGRSLSVANAPRGLLRLARLCDAVDLLNLTGRSGDGDGAS